MATLNTQNYSTILQNWIAAAQGTAQAALDFTAGSILRAVAQAQAGVALWLQGLVLNALIASRLSSAVAAAGANNSLGPDVDSFVADFGLSRFAGQASTGQVTFSRFTPAAQAVVPAAQVVGGVIQAGGAILQTLDGTQNFTVIADNTQPAYSAALGGYVVNAGEASVVATVMANNIGLQGNIIANSLSVLQTGISGIDTVTNPVAFGNGRNAETNGALQSRFTATFQSLSNGTTAAIIRAVTSYNGNLQCSVQLTPLQNPAVTVTVDDGSGAIPAGLLNGAAQAVASVMADGISFAVVAATMLTANVAISITTAAGFPHSAVAALVETAIANYIDALGLGNALDFFNLSAVALGVTGVTGITSLTLNGAAFNIVPTQAQTIKAGTVAVA